MSMFFLPQTLGATLSQSWVLVAELLAVTYKKHLGSAAAAAVQRPWHSWSVT